MKAVFNMNIFTDASLCICFDDGVRVDMQPLASGGWRGEAEELLTRVFVTAIVSAATAKR